MSKSEVKTFALGDFTLASGAVLPQAFIAYKTFGDPSSPAIIYPTWYSGHIADNEWLIGTGRALDPASYHIIIPALFGNGESSSPSNMPHLPTDKPFPDVTFRDNVTAQHRLVTEGLGVWHARAVLGWSMGAGQTYQWLTQFPDFVDLGVPFCGSARTSLHNQVFLEGPKSALLASRGAASAGICAGESSGPDGYRKWTAEERERGLKAVGRVYAGWGLSQAFYREKLYENLGYKDLEDFMVKFWEGWFSTKGMCTSAAIVRLFCEARGTADRIADPENLLVMLHTWQAGDCSDQEPYNKDFELAMRSIKAKTLVLPGQTDLYFPPEDSEYEVKCMSEGVGKCIAFPSIWGHWSVNYYSRPL